MAQKGNLVFKVSKTTDNIVEKRAISMSIYDTIERFLHEFPDCLASRPKVEIDDLGAYIYFEVFYTDVSNLSRMQKYYDDSLIYHRLREADEDISHYRRGGDKFGAKRPWWNFWGLTTVECPH